MFHNRPPITAPNIQLGQATRHTIKARRERHNIKLPMLAALGPDAGLGEL